MYEKYIKEFDCIRAFAILSVLASHWITVRNPQLNYFLSYCGPLGVNVFFVLSGFLITKILLTNKKKIDNRNSSISSILVSFYIRRTLRIFPIYYLVILLLYLFSDSTDSDLLTSYPYFLTYTSNIYFFCIGKFDGILSHFWSLAVEEQFYLLWPVLILFARSKYVLSLIYLFIIIGIISQFLLRDYTLSSILTITCFDSFGMGALLAWHLVYADSSLKYFYMWTKRFVIISLILLVFSFWSCSWIQVPLFRTLISILTLFILTHILHYSLNGKPLPIKFIWYNKYLIFIGKISYGMYLYHNLIPHFTQKALNNLLHVTSENMLPYKLGYVVMLIFNFILLLVLSWLSWKLIEKPFLRLKNYFDYIKSRNIIGNSNPI
jgi:peptidoglycan/LPS O-acetylase OafA/YrhL